MFLGHYGVAFALKRAEPKLSLGTLFVAVQFADLLWGIFILLGWEHANLVSSTPNTPIEFVDYPISHSLVGALAWSIVAAALYYSWPTRDTSRHWQAAAVVGLAVLSHYPLDVLVHLRDLPLSGNDSTKLGLGLWNHPTATLILETLTLAAGVAVYVAKGSKRHPVRLARLLVLLVVLIGAYLASSYGPPPPNITVVGVSVIVLILFVAALGGWADQRSSQQELAGRGSHRR